MDLFAKQHAEKHVEGKNAKKKQEIMKELSI